MSESIVWGGNLRATPYKGELCKKGGDMHRLFHLGLCLTLTFSLYADIRVEKKSEGSYNHPTPEIREPLPGRIKYLKIRLPKRPMLEHRRLYRRLGILPPVFEYCLKIKGGSNELDTNT